MSLLSTEWLFERPLEYDIDDSMSKHQDKLANDLFTSYLSDEYKPSQTIEKDDELIEMSSRIEREMSKIQKESSEFISFVKEKENIICMYTISCRVCVGTTSDFFMFESYIFIITHKNVYKGKIQLNTYDNIKLVYTKPLNFHKIYTFDKQLSHQLCQTLQSYCNHLPSTFLVQSNQGYEALKQAHLSYYKMFMNILTSIPGTFYSDLLPHWKTIYNENRTESYLNLETSKIIYYPPYINEPIRYN